MKKKKGITLVTAFLMIIALIGITYALLRFQLTGEKSQVLRIGDLELKLEETGNTLGLESGEPLSDEEGLSLQGFDFTLKNDSTKTVDYTIYLDDVELDSDTDIRIDDKNIKYSLDKNGTKGEAKPLTDTGVNPERVLEEGSIGKNQQNDYTLRIWVINSQEDITDQVFKAKIRVENTLKPNDINVDNNNIVLDINKKKQEQININKEELGEVTYQSKDKEVAEVSPDGLITAVGIGSTEIEVISGTYKQTIRVKVEKTVEATYVKQGLGVQEIEKEKDSCVLKTKGEVCEKTLPTITMKSDEYTAVGWNESQNAEEGQNGTITFQDNVTYYAISYKNEIPYKVFFNGNGNVIDSEEKSCSLPKAYNDNPQPTSCTVTTPTISVNEKTPIIVGYNQEKSAKTAEVGNHEELKVDASNNGKTYYAITKSEEQEYTVKFDGNNNQIDAEEKSCSIKETYNGESQEAGCTVVTPTISVNPNTPTIIGYSTKTDDHTKTVGSKESLTINETNNGTTYYAQTTKEKVNYNVKFDANNNIIDEVEKACSLAATFNGVEQATTCTIMTPTITAPANTKVIVGYHQDKTSHIAEVGSNQELIVSAENHNKTYYAITKSEAITRNVNYSMQGLGVTQIGKESDNCTIGETYNNAKQDTSCTVDAPDITVSEGYTKVGWSEDKESESGTAVGAKITLSKDTAPTYYSISYKNEVTYKVNFNANNNQIDVTEKTCTIGKAYNTTPQGTTCNIETPTISVNSITPDIIGYSIASDNHDKVVGSKENLIVDSNINGKTYYAQTTAPAKTHTITFNKNGAQSQTDESNIAQTTETVTRSCTREATFNGTAQAETCSVTSPTIVGTNITPTVTGYSDAAGNHTNGWSHNSKKDISGDATWYAQTTKGEVTKNVTYKTTTGVTSIGKESDSCTIAAIYNNNEGKSQDTSCTVQAPTINAASGYEAIGWNTSSSSATTGTKPGENLTLTDASTTYYALAKQTVVPAVDKLLSSYTNAANLQDYQNSTATQQKNMYVFTHTAGAQQSNYTSEELTDYRYIGADPNNYVTFNDETWRIIGIFTVEDANGTKEKRIKLIRNEPLPVGTDNKISWDNKPSGTGSSNSSYGSNWWGDARLMMVLNPGYESDSLASGGKGSLYWNGQSGNCPKGSRDGTTDCDFTSTGLTSTAQRMIGDTKWYLGGTASYTSASNGTAAHFYSYERGKEAYGVNAINLNATSKEVKKDSIIESIAQPMINAIANTTRGISWTGKVGLMYPSDYGYATSGGNSANRETCLAKDVYHWYSSSEADCKNNDWLFIDGKYQWTIAPHSGDSDFIFIVSYDGSFDEEYVNGYDLNNVLARPSVYLKASTLYKSGDGSQGSPFVFTSDPNADDEGPVCTVTSSSFTQEKCSDEREGIFTIECIDNSGSLKND